MTPVTAPPQAKAETAAGPAAIVKLEFDPEVRPAWLTDGMNAHVPVPPGEPAKLPGGRVLVWGQYEKDRWLPLMAVSEAGLEPAYPWAQWQAYILTERYATWRRRPLHTRLPFSYRTVPPRLRRTLWRPLCRHREAEHTAFPSPPFDGGFEALRSVWRRYQEAPTPTPAPRICLTHDIESAVGFEFVKRIAEVESALGLRSCWNVVPFEYRLDFCVCDWLCEQGHEVGLHGYCHDNKLVYLKESRLRRRLDACRGFLERYAIRGFRSPSWLRNARLMRVLADYVDYDCSCLDFDWRGLAGRGGVLTATPFRFGRLVEIPTTLPFEGRRVVGADPDETLAYWQPKTDWLVQVQGQAVVNTHPDPQFLGNDPMIRAYGQFLEGLLVAYGGRWSLPRDLAEEVAPDV